MRISSTGFFLALSIFYTLAKRGVFNLRSTVNTAGRLTSTYCIPKSTSRITFAEDVSRSIFELNVAQGMSMIEAKIYPVYT